MSILLLYQKSLLDINDPISKYLTDFSIKNPETGEKQDMIILNTLLADLHQHLTSISSCPDMDQT